ncbi:MAG: isoprenylcysteine carboxylmethyltransferase family protein [Pseudomonadota bacterium]|uniref:Protein-S-isoprenylcysteine O-methyltransferase Ste14 n=1 Tax=Tahibacter aquaticus TaxID=520092 RepID=A0A4V3DL93_9GAMM|nr:isoprenylcysteine carboxylmethyltransferase family protein [Tahibacter aquaticus]TDR38396.1 protein-S-isoprenylcysteine O-methyltransferase Ste14 [Tahibacter aquaticus]
MNPLIPGYGLWTLAVLNAAFFIFFAWSFYTPLTTRDWRSFGLYSAFVVALFAEMYGFPLSLFLLSGWLSSRFPEVNWLSHDAGHVLEMMFGWRSNPHFGPFHILSFVLIGGGFWLLARAWPVLYQAQRSGELAQTGPYARLRHPQYVGFALIMTGFLVQWPTLLTLVLYPVMLITYVRLAINEEHETRARFGTAYEQYADAVPRFFPRRRRPLAVAS